MTVIITAHKQDKELETVIREIGTIIRVDRHGLAMLKTENGENVYPFTFDKIVRYRGQAAKEIGLGNGATVRFSTVHGKAEDVEIVKAAEGASL